MALQWTTTAQKVAPAAAGAVSITPNATSWANSVWVQVLASAPAALLLTGVSIPTVGIAQPFEIDVGVGGVGAEAVITTLKGDYTDLTAHGTGTMPHVLPLDAIPAASRVAVRLRKNGTSVVAWTVAITYLDTPITGNLQTTTQPQRALPAAAVPVTVTSTTTPWGNGAWVVLTAAAAADLVVTGLIVRTLNAGVQWEVDLGVGGVGTEAVITTVHGARGNFADGPNVVPLWNPLDAIPSGSRVVTRLRCNDTLARTSAVAIVYHQKPL